MYISIDAPEKRSLTPNEKTVYRLLGEGITPFEIAKKMHLPLECSCLLNRYDVPAESVMGIISSIREKGWEIPEKNGGKRNGERSENTG